MAESKEPTTPTWVLVDGVMMQAALRAALAIAPSGQGHKYAVVGITFDDTSAVVVVRNPKINTTAMIVVPAPVVELRKEEDAHIEITIPEVRRLLAQKVAPPSDDEPWPELAWTMTADRIVQTDANTLFGRRTDVRPTAMHDHVLTDAHATLIDVINSRRDSGDHPMPGIKQAKVVTAALAGLGEDPTIVALDPGDRSESCVLWTTPQAAIFTRTPKGDDTGQIDQQDSHEEPKALPAPPKLVAAHPPGGIA